MWPDWIKNPAKVRGGKDAQMIRAEQREQQKLIQKIVEKLPDIKIKEPKEEDLPTSTKYVRDQEVRQGEEINRKAHFVW